MAEQVDPSRIMQIGMGFWASKILLEAVDMELFTLLAQGPATGSAIGDALGLHERGLYDFLDALVALGFLQREGLRALAVYSNAADTDLFLDKNKPSYMGGILAMSNHRLYPVWQHLAEGLKTGQPQNEIVLDGKEAFEELYEDQDTLREFLAAMGGIQQGNFIAFAQRFDFSNYTTLCDVGGAGGFLSAQVALHHDHMQCISFDLPQVLPIAAENLAHMQVAHRVETKEGDFFSDPLPKADVITMGNILHDWGVDDKKMLIRKAYEALPVGGSLVVIENIIDDDRSANAFGLMMSLNMLLETKEGFDYSTADFAAWATEAGFSSVSSSALTGPSSAVVAVK